MLPDASNVFLALHTTLAPADVAALFARHGWAARAAGFAESNVRIAWADLHIEGAGPVLVHGPVADPLDRLDALLAPLLGADIAVTGEVYGPDGALLKTIHA